MHGKFSNFLLFTDHKPNLTFCLFLVHMKHGPFCDWYEPRSILTQKSNISWVIFTYHPQETHQMGSLTWSSENQIHCLSSQEPLLCVLSQEIQPLVFLSSRIFHHQLTTHAWISCQERRLCGLESSFHHLSFWQQHFFFVIFRGPSKLSWCQVMLLFLLFM